MTAHDSAINPAKLSDNDPKDKQTYEVRVFSPGAVDPKEFSFDKHLTVAEAAAQAAAAFGISADNPTLAKGAKVLDRGRQLVAAGVRDDDDLELVDTGGGV